MEIHIFICCSSYFLDTPLLHNFLNQKINTCYKYIFVFSQKYSVAVCVMVSYRKSTARRLLNLQVKHVLPHLCPKSSFAICVCVLTFTLYMFERMKLCMYAYVCIHAHI